MGERLSQKLKKEIQQLKQNVNSLNVFLKAVYNQGSNKCSKMLSKIPPTCKAEATNIVRLLEDFENQNRKINTLQTEKNDWQKKYNQTDCQLIKLRKSNNQKIFKDLKSGKNIDVVADIMQLLTKKKYQQALELAKTTDFQSIVLDLWEYRSIKSQFNKSIKNNFQNVQQPVNIRPAYKIIINLLKGQASNICRLEKQYGKVLQDILDLFYNKNTVYQFQNIEKQNKRLVQTIELKHRSFMNQFRLLKQKSDSFHDRFQKNLQQQMRQDQLDQQFLHYQKQLQITKKKQKNNNSPNKKSSKQTKKMKQYSSVQNQNDHLVVTLTSKIVQIAKALKIQVSKKLQKQISKCNNMQIFKYIQQTIQYWYCSKQSMEERINQLQNDQKRISQKLQSVNYNICSLLNMQNCVLFEKFQGNCQKCDVICENVQSASIMIDQMNNKIDYLQKIDYKDTQIISSPQKQLSFKPTNNRDYFYQNKAKIYVEEQCTQFQCKNEQYSGHKNQDLDQKCISLQGKIQELKKEIESLNKWTVDLNTQISKFQDQINCKDAQIESQKQLIAELKNDIIKQRQQVKSCNDKVSKHRQKIYVLQSRIKSQITSKLKTSTFKFNQNLFQEQSSPSKQSRQTNNKKIDLQKQQTNPIQQANPTLANRLASKKIQEAQKQVQRLKAQLQAMKKKNSQNQQTIISKQAENQAKLNKLRNDNSLINKKIINLQKKQSQNEAKYKKLLQDFYQILAEVDRYALQNTELANQLQEQRNKRELNGIQDKTPSTIRNAEKHNQAIFVVKQSSVHHGLKQNLANIEQIQKIKQEYTTKIEDLQKIIMELQYKYQQSNNKIKVLINESSQKQDKNLKQITKLTETLHKIQIDLQSKQKQIILLQQQKLLQIQKNHYFQQQIKLSLAQNHKKYTISRQQRFTDHIFTSGDIFDQFYDAERHFLIDQLQNRKGKIIRTRLIYKYDNYNKVNVHKYVDNHKQIVVIVRTEFGKLIAGYSQQAFTPNGITRGDGLLLSLWNQKTFNLIEGKKAISYDDFYIIFGNSQIRLKSLQLLIFSNFGINAAFYQTRGYKISQWLGEDNRQVPLDGYEIYQLEFDN